MPWLDVFGPSTLWSGRDRCCCCVASGSTCTSLCEEEHAVPTECSSPADEEALLKKRVAGHRMDYYASLAPLQSHAHGAVLAALPWLVGLSTGEALNIEAGLASARPRADVSEDRWMSESDLPVSQTLFARQPQQMWTSETWSGADLCLLDLRWKNILGVKPEEPLGFDSELPDSPVGLKTWLLMFTLLGSGIVLMVSLVVRRLFLLSPTLWDGGCSIPLDHRRRCPLLRMCFFC